MRQRFYNKKNDVLIYQRNIFVVTSCILFIVVFLLSCSLFRKDINTILVPFDFNTKIAVSQKRPSNEYLESITRDIINTMLNLTPNNIYYAEKVVLSFAHGSTFGLLKKQFSKVSDIIVNKKFSTVFYPTSITPNNKTMTVLVKGILYTYFGTKEVEKSDKLYEIKYNYQSGKLSIISFKEFQNNINENTDNI